MDIRDFSERPIDDMRPPKPPRKTKAYILDLIHPPGSPDYMVMNYVVMDIPKPPLLEIRSLLAEKRKVPIRRPACLKRLPLKAAFNNNDIYVKNTDSGKNLYEGPQEKRAAEEEQEPKVKNMRVFYKLNINDNTNVTSTPHGEEYGCSIDIYIYMHCKKDFVYI